MSALELNELPNQLTIEDSARGVLVVVVGGGGGGGGGERGGEERKNMTEANTISLQLMYAVTDNTEPSVNQQSQDCYNRRGTHNVLLYQRPEHV